jgi:uncharacterized protein (UPF0332 family)
MITDDVLREFSTLTGKEYRRLKLVCEAQTLDSQSLEEIVKEVALDRWKLALSFARFAKNLPVETDNLRNIISRNYYACYQAARALVFFITRLDVDGHKELPKKFTACVSSEHVKYADILKKWRDIRNEVDYSPYPITRDLKEAAQESCIETANFLSVCKDEFIKRGVYIENDQS